MILHLVRGLPYLCCNTKSGLIGRENTEILGDLRKNVPDFMDIRPINPYIIKRGVLWLKE
jgi:hypothetical protein